MNLLTLPENKHGRDFVIGDLHGNYDMFQAALQHVNFNPDFDRVLSCGDLVDRGPKSFECLQLVFEPWFYVIQGNHEDMMTGSISDVSGHVAQNFFMNGGNWAFGMLNELTKSNPSDEAVTFRDACQIVESAPMMIRTSVNGSWHYLVHAELPPAKIGNPYTDSDFEKQLETVIQSQKHSFLSSNYLQWAREIFYNAAWMDLDVNAQARQTVKGMIDGFQTGCKDFGVIYSGHTPLRKPIRSKHLFALDTGAFIKDGKLTMHCLHTDETYSVNKDLTVNKASVYDFRT